MKLTYQTLANAKPRGKPYKLRDRDSMYLLISAAGSKTWKFDYRLEGKDCTFTLGRFPDLSLNDARQRRTHAAELVAHGHHPKAYEKLQQQQTISRSKDTFWAACNDWLDDHAENWSVYYHGQATRFLTRYIKKSPLAIMPIRDITVVHIYELLQSIAKRKAIVRGERKVAGAPHIAVRVRQHLDAIFRRAIISGRTDNNPVAALRVSDLLTVPPTRHNRALDAQELKCVLDALKIAATPLTRLAMRLLLLTSVRTGELRCATWKEFDLEIKTWVIPGERMKMRRPHVVPLNTQALQVLEQLKKIAAATADDDYLFPNVKDKSRPMAATTINAALIRSGFNGNRLFRAHGMRGTFSTWAHEQGFTPLAIERQLAHVERNHVSRAYNKAELLPERQAMIQKWGDYLDHLN